MKSDQTNTSLHMKVVNQKQKHNQTDSSESMDQSDNKMNRFR